MKAIINQVKLFAKDNEKDVVLIVGIVLISLISFGAGRLSAGSFNSAGSVEFVPAPASISELFMQADTDDSAGIEADQTANSAYQGRVVASKNGTKYHRPNCTWAKRIAVQNQVWFDSAQEAETAGYESCAYFAK